MKPSGFSLIEVLAAMAVALVLVAGTAELIALSLTAKRSGDTASDAARILAAKIEGLKSAPFDGPELEPGEHRVTIAGEAGRRDFVLWWEIKDSGEGMKSVRLRVHPRGRSRSGAALTCFVSRELGFAP